MWRRGSLFRKYGLVNDFIFQAAVAQKKAIGHADRAVIIPGYSLVSVDDNYIIM